jgi:hypothetical protein
MRTEASVDLLRTTLITRGHILPTRTQRDSDCRILNHGEYLVSLLSQDDQLMDFLFGVIEGEGRFSGIRVSSTLQKVDPFDGSESVSYMIYDIPFGRNIDLYVDTVKFVWLAHGFTAAFDFIKAAGLYEWSNNNSEAARVKYIDGLVLLTQKKLRQYGTKYSDMAEFFADARASKDLHGTA